MSWLDYLIVAIYLLIVLGIGIICARGQNTLAEFFLGARSIPWWAAACSGVAGMVSGVAYLGGPGLAFTRNYEYHQMRLGIPIALLAICGIMLPTFFRLKVYSIYQYLEQRFERRVRLLASAIFLFSKFSYLTIVIYAPSLVVAQATGLSMVTVILGLGIGTTAYTLVGGMKAVVWTDTLQVAVLLGGIGVTLVTVLHKVPGGLPEVMATAHAAGRLRFINWSPSLKETYTVWSGLIGGAVVVISQFGSNQAEIQRFLSTRSIRHANRALISAMLISVLIGVTLFFIGTCLFGYYSAFPAKGGLAADPNRIYAKFMIEELPSGVRGVLVAAVLAASMSAISVTLNSLATVITVDFAPLWRKRPSTVRDAKVATLLFGLAVTGVACWGGHLGNLSESGAHVISLFMGSLTGVFLLGMIWRSATATAAFWSLLAGTAAAIAVDCSYSISFLWLSPIAALVTIVSGLIISWADRRSRVVVPFSPSSP